MVLAKYPSILDVDHQRLSLMFYSCAQDEPITGFQTFPTSDVDMRAAAAYTRTKKAGIEDHFCLTAILLPEEEAAAYQDVLQTTLQRVIEVNGDPLNRRRRYQRILADTFKKIQRRGGSRDQSLCPYMYERPIEDDLLKSYCRVVKKQCYLSIYHMPGFPQCPRYIRRQRRTQLANARKIVRAGIQRILEEADEKRLHNKGHVSGSWAEPIHAIIERIFSVLAVSDETIDLARQIAEQVEQKALFQGHPRPIVAASIAYLSIKQTPDNISENDIIELVGCSRTSLRRNYRELRGHLAVEGRKKSRTIKESRSSRQKKVVAQTK